MLKELLLGGSLIGLIAYCGTDASYEPLSLSTSLAEKFGHQVWQNECREELVGLTSWNAEEDFASLGIGHFIWFPDDGKERCFKQSFPELLRFFQAHEVILPDLFLQNRSCPWKSREDFFSTENELILADLQEFLAKHVDLQIEFMVQRLQAVLPVLLRDGASFNRRHRTYQFYRMSHTIEGLFLLLDYVNFKGEGIRTSEKYRGRGWGLMQVLDAMSGTEPGIPSVDEFIDAAKAILRSRVENSPPERNEEKWLPGWDRRLEKNREFCHTLANEPIAL